MTDVAWVGRLRDFQKEFGVKEGKYFDKDTDTTYWCICTPTRMHSLHFDVAERGYEVAKDRYHYYGAMYDEIINTRIKQ